MSVVFKMVFKTLIRTQRNNFVDRYFKIAEDGDISGKEFNI